MLRISFASASSASSRIRIGRGSVSGLVVRSLSSSGVEESSSTSFRSLNADTPPGQQGFNLCFVRHGQSTWNRDNRFIGWTDTPLTEAGTVEARLAGKMLAKSGMKFDDVHTSLLRRCVRTANLVLMELEQEYLPMHKHWRLNERSYGNLVGLNKKEVVKQFGKEQVLRWRRSYDEPPPPMGDQHEYHPKNDPRYRTMLDCIPPSESLKCTVARSKVYWDDAIAPSLQSGRTVLIVGHENNLRSLVMRLEGIGREEIVNLSLPRGVPLAYRVETDESTGRIRPLARDDGRLDEATGMLRGTWLGGDDAVRDVLERDHKQVYDTTVTQNLELEDDNTKLRRLSEMAVEHGRDLRNRFAAKRTPSPRVGGTARATMKINGAAFSSSASNGEREDDTSIDAK